MGETWRTSWVKGLSCLIAKILFLLGVCLTGAITWIWLVNQCSEFIIGGYLFLGLVLKLMSNSLYRSQKEYHQGTDYNSSSFSFLTALRTVLYLWNGSMMSFSPSTQKKKKIQYSQEHRLWISKVGHTSKQNAKTEAEWWMFAKALVSTIIEGKKNNTKQGTNYKLLKNKNQHKTNHQLLLLISNNTSKQTWKPICSTKASATYCASSWYNSSPQDNCRKFCYRYSHVRDH